MLVGVPGRIVTTPERLKRVRHNRSRKQRWTRRVRARFVANFGRSPVLSGIIATLLLPGGFVLVPFIVWWHRRKRAAEQALQGKRAHRGRKVPSRSR